jgi:excisionase family DNA binding protein
MCSKKRTMELLTVNEFAAALRMTPACIRRWILVRRISFMKIGRSVRIPSSELDRLITAGTVPAGPQKA